MQRSGLLFLQTPLQFSHSLSQFGAGLLNRLRNLYRLGRTIRIISFNRKKRDHRIRGNGEGQWVSVRTCPCISAGLRQTILKPLQDRAACGSRVFGVGVHDSRCCHCFFSSTHCSQLDVKIFMQLNQFPVGICNKKEVHAPVPEGTGTHCGSVPDSNRKTGLKSPYRLLFPWPESACPRPPACAPASKSPAAPASPLAHGRAPLLPCLPAASPPRANSAP